MGCCSSKNCFSFSNFLIFFLASSSVTESHLFRAITSGFANVRGKYIITLDADLQNPPEEIPKIIAKMDEGYDVIGTCRQNRHDPLFRKVASRFVNRMTNRISGLHISDYGCMLRGYSRRIVDIIVQSRESTTFIPALGQKFAVNPIEIPVSHREREFGESKYSFFRLLRLNFDLMTSFSIAPLQMVTMSGMGISLLSIIFFLYLILRCIIVGPEADGVFTLMAINFFLIGATIMALGIIGEYTGRIYKQIQQRPHYIIRKIYLYIFLLLYKIELKMNSKSYAYARVARTREGKRNFVYSQ